MPTGSRPIRLCGRWSRDYFVGQGITVGVAVHMIGDCGGTGGQPDADASCIQAGLSLAQ